MDKQAKINFHLAQIIKKHGIYCEFTKKVTQEAKVYIGGEKKIAPIVQINNSKTVWQANINGIVHQGQAEENIVKGILVDTKIISNEFKKMLGFLEIKAIEFENKNYFLFELSDHRFRHIFKMALLDKNIPHPNKILNSILKFSAQFIWIIRRLKKFIFPAFFCTLILNFFIWLIGFKEDIHNWFNQMPNNILSNLYIFFSMISVHTDNSIRDFKINNLWSFIFTWLFFVFILDFNFKKYLLKIKNSIFNDY